MLATTGIYFKHLISYITFSISRQTEEQPKQKWKKAKLKEWLDSKRKTNLWKFQWVIEFAIGIPYPEKALKKEMWEIIKQNKPPPKYVTDEFAKEKGKH